MAKHRRRDANTLLTAGQYEQLVNVLHRHRPGERSGLCLVCGIGWASAARYSAVMVNSGCGRDVVVVRRTRVRPRLGGPAYKRLDSTRLSDFYLLTLFVFTF